MAWNAICDVCGFKFKNDQLLKRWDGLMVCSEDFETRHPQDFIRPVVEKAIPWSRPDKTDATQEVAINSDTQTTIPTGTFTTNNETL